MGNEIGARSTRPDASADTMNTIAITPIPIINGDIHLPHLWLSYCGWMSEAFTTGFLTLFGSLAS